MERIRDIVILHKPEVPENRDETGNPLATLTKKMKKCIKN